MERIMSVEEKIRRAEEIYAKRHGQNLGQTATLNLGNNNKKDIKLLKKLVMQVVACLCIYLIVYTIQNNNYIFSEDFMNKAKEILSYDTNFMEMYNNSKKYIMQFLNEKENKDNEQNEEINNEENIGGSNEEVETENATEETPIDGDKKDEEVKELSEEDKKILQIKDTTSFIKPIEGKITSRYGQREPTTATVPKNHTGTDIGAAIGTKIKSATDGEVVLASSEGDYGNHLKIQIGEVSIIYAHCNSLYVKQGDKVTQGQEIAEVGSTGNSTGPHLHFEIRLNESTIDPQKILEL